MKQLIGIIQSVISDMKLLRKPFINYTLVYIGLAVISNLVSLFNSSNKAVNSFLYLVTLAVSVFQTAAIVYFQRAYIKQQIGNVVFNSIFTVILHLYFIYFILQYNFLGTLFFLHLQLLYEVSSYEFLELYLMFFQGL